MKKSLLLIGLVFLSFSASAQLFKFGVQAGLGGSGYGFDELSYNNEQSSVVLILNPEGGAFSYNVGATAHLTLEELPIGFRGSVLFSSMGGKVNIHDYFVNSYTLIEEKNTRLDIPLSLSFNLNSFRVIGGFGYAIDLNRGGETVEYLNSDYVETGKFNFDVISESANYWTFNFGIGFEGEKVAIDIIYNGRMNQNISGDRDANLFVFSPNPSGMTINLSYFFL